MQATIGEMLAAAARRFGSKPLVVATDRTLTFAQLDQLTAEEIIFIVNDCGAKAIIAAQGKIARLEGHVSALVIADTAGAGAPEGRSLDSLLAASTNDAGDGSHPSWSDGDGTSTIGYTSGTTGHPKGAVLRHYNGPRRLGSIGIALPFTRRKWCSPRRGSECVAARVGRGAAHATHGSRVICPFNLPGLSRCA